MPQGAARRCPPPSLCPGGAVRTPAVPGRGDAVRMRPGKMAPAAGSWAARVLWALLAAALGRAALALTEQYPALSLLKQELHRQRQGPAGGCASAGEWVEQYSAECDSSFLHFHESDCDIRGSSSCESVLSLNTEKILSQAKSLAEQKRFPFATDNDNTNEELELTRLYQKVPILTFGSVGWYHLPTSSMSSCEEPGSFWCVHAPSCTCSEKKKCFAQECVKCLGHF
uniref:Tetratricopeptide repeat domain 13 n=1 Tax=Apteryx owenii TaxID=8824 RepID=A0A8B9Q3V7_APTOW